MSAKRQPARFNSWASASPMPEDAPTMTAVRVDCLLIWTADYRLLART
jgi:hypothetical protein